MAHSLTSYGHPSTNNERRSHRTITEICENGKYKPTAIQRKEAVTRTEWKWNEMLCSAISTTVLLCVAQGSDQRLKSPRRTAPGALPPALTMTSTQRPRLDPWPLGQDSSSSIRPSPSRAQESSAYDMWQLPLMATIGCVFTFVALKYLLIFQSNSVHFGLSGNLWPVLVLVSHFLFLTSCCSMESTDYPFFTFFMKSSSTLDGSLDKFSQYFLRFEITSDLIKF